MPEILKISGIYFFNVNFLLPLVTNRCIQTPIQSVLGRLDVYTPFMKNSRIRSLRNKVILIFFAQYLNDFC